MVPRQERGRLLWTDLKLPEPIAATSTPRGLDSEAVAAASRSRPSSRTRDTPIRSRCHQGVEGEASARYRTISDPSPWTKDGDNRYEPADRQFPGSPGRFAVRLPPRARKIAFLRDHAMSFDLQLANRRALVTGGTQRCRRRVVGTLVTPEHRSVATARIRAFSTDRRRALPCR